LKDSENELKRLKLAEEIPNIKDIRANVHASAFGVMEAILNLVGQQLIYFATILGKTGLISK
jgi:hypothetical protein